MNRIATVDQGNGSAKFSLWEVERGDARLSRRRRSSREQWRAPAGLAFLSEWSPEAVVFSSVAGDEARESLAQGLREHVRGALLDELDSGLENRTRTPETVGRDRLLAARGALEIVGRSAIVVDAGTALTVDAVRAAEGVDPAAFLGGAIAPGPDLLARAMAEGAAQLYVVEARPDARALGRDTREALEAGVSVGFVGAARELVRRVAEESGFVDPPLVLTGGARHLLADVSAPGGARVVVEELVERGLLAAAGEHLDGAAWRVAP